MSHVDFCTQEEDGGDVKKITLKDSHSKLPKSVQDIVCMIFDVDSMKKAMKEFEVILTLFPPLTSFVVCSHVCLCILVTYIAYSKTCEKLPFSKRPNIDFQDQLSLNAGQKYCRMLPLIAECSPWSILQYF